MVNKPAFIHDRISYFLHLSPVNKLTLVLLFTLVLTNVTSLSYLPILAEAYTEYHSKAKNGGTGVGEGSSEDKKYRESLKLKQHKITMPSPAIGGIPTIQNGCNCVIFRLDDVQDYWLSSIQTTVMDQFIKKNQPVSVGPILNYIGDDLNVVSKVKQGHTLGLFDLYVHGWNHVDYSQLDLTTQIHTLQKANDKMDKLFGNNHGQFRQ